MVYSFEVIVFFVLTGGRVPNVNIKDISKRKSETISKEIGMFFGDLIRRCMSLDQKECPSFKMIDDIENEFKKIKDFLFL